MSIPVSVLFIIIGFITTFSTQAANHQDMHAIQNAVENFVQVHTPHTEKEKIKISVTRLNHHLKLSACAEKPSLSEVPNANQRYMKTIMVSCSTPTPWKIYVTARIQRYQPVLIATDTILKNKTITHNQLKLVEKETSVLRTGYFTQFNQLQNTKSKRTITAGDVITPRMIKQKDMITRGQRVTIIAKAGNINVEVAGTAKESGVLGDTIQVTNRSTNKVIHVKVVGHGIVSIT